MTDVLTCPTCNGNGVVPLETDEELQQARQALLTRMTSGSSKRAEVHANFRALARLERLMAERGIRPDGESTS